MVLSLVFSLAFALVFFLVFPLAFSLVFSVTLSLAFSVAFSVVSPVFGPKAIAFQPDFGTFQDELIDIFPLQVSFSHIITHLRESGHREIDFKFDGAVGNPDSCNLCNSRNVFTLGFLWGSKSNRYLLCHPPCREFIVEKQGLKERIIGKPKYTNYDEYFTKLRTKMMQFHLYINGEAKLRADGLSCYPHFTFPPHSGKEVANIAKW